MSRVHDALRKAEQLAAQSAAKDGQPPSAAIEGSVSADTEEASGIEEQIETQSVIPATVTVAPSQPPITVNRALEPKKSAQITLNGLALDLSSAMDQAQEIPFTPLPEAHLLDPSKPYEVPNEEFRTLRTRLNHLQTLQPIHSVVITSPSPAEGKSMSAANLAIAEAQLEGNPTVIADFDFRRPMVHQLFQIDRGPGIIDFLLGKAELRQIIRKVQGQNLYIMPAGQAVMNPLELLNLPQAKNLLKALPQIFNWVILDSPPLLFAADAALLGTMTDGTILVVRIGSTAIDSVTKAINSVCENNILGVVVNGASRGEMYSKYNYYNSYYQEGTETPAE